ncbi:nucleotidyltransferase family protein [Paracoccus laeviglucosivorans]|uniref:nucleotidyltransferase family protein n=1 Tax=Paracoccus laeviglucosivorans TaxID=1197861 RepID=UPI001159B980|nr:nucleotidyltransferase family protein [Paracoccus laeviglucosivorans]
MITGALVLAAGQSRRFGSDDKLLAPLRGKPMVSATFDLVRHTELDARLVVVSNPRVATLAEFHGLKAVQIASGQEQSASLREGLAILRKKGVERLLVLLGDMPFLATGDITRLLSCDGSQASCAQLNGQPMPPAVFPASWFDRLERTSGDRGASAMLRDIPTELRLPLAPERLRDIDLRSDLSSLS